MAIMDIIFGDVHYTLNLGEVNGFLGIAGNLSGANAQRMTAMFRKVVDRLQGRLFLSLEGLKALDSMAIGLLVQNKKVLDDTNHPVVLVDVPPNIRALLDGAHISDLFEIVPTLQEAEIKYGRSSGYH